MKKESIAKEQSPAKILGSLGGKATMKKHGKKFMKKISKIAAQKRTEKANENN